MTDAPHRDPLTGRTLTDLDKKAIRGLVAFGLIAVVFLFTLTVISALGL